MNQPNHQEYYLTRAQSSRALAQRAADPAIAAIHSDFATRYDIMAAQLDQKVDMNGRGAQA